MMTLKYYENIIKTNMETVCRETAENYFADSIEDIFGSLENADNYLIALTGAKYEYENTLENLTTPEGTVLVDDCGHWTSHAYGLLSKAVFGKDLYNK